jgi:AcrR family transcriptional regulator
MAVRLSRAERKERTRDEVVAAAQRVFLRDGFHGATLDAIADEAGYTKGAVYSNFDGKDALFLALLDEVYEERIAWFHEAVVDARSLAEALRANARLLAEAVLREPRWTPLLVEFWTHASRHPQLRAEAASRHDRVLDGIAGLISELFARYGVAPAIPVRDLVRDAQAFARGMALERLLAPDAFSIEHFEDEFVAFVTTHLRPVTGEGA